MTLALPDESAITAWTAQGELGTATPATGVLGISDPRAHDSRIMDIIEDTGVTWVRLEIYWTVVQPTPGGPMNWSLYDGVMADYATRGISVAAILTYMPDQDLFAS